MINLKFEFSVRSLRRAILSKFGHPIRSGKSERDYNQRLYETYTDKCVDSVYRHGYDF